jgi:hypothetical protein
MRIEDGPSLCVGCQLCWGIKLQVFPSFLGMFLYSLVLKPKHSISTGFIHSKFVQ